MKCRPNETSRGRLTWFPWLFFSSFSASVAQRADITERCQVFGAHVYVQTCLNAVRNAVIDLLQKLGADGAELVAHYSDVRFANKRFVIQSRIFSVNCLIWLTKPSGSQQLIRNNIVHPKIVIFSTCCAKPI